MSLFGVELNHQVNRIIAEIRLHIQKLKFIPNVRTIYRSFALLDTQVTGTVSSQQFQKALSQNGVFMKAVDLQILATAFNNGNGVVNWFQFLGTLKIPMDEQRIDLASKIFESLAKKYERLTPENLLKEFDPSQIEIVKTGKISKEHAQQQLISLLPFPDGHLTKDQFIAFYDDLSLNFAHYDAFAKYVSHHWSYCPTNQPQSSQQTLRSIIKALRFKLIQKSQGTSDQFLLKKLFNEFGENKSGYISQLELELMLKKLELPIAANNVEPLFKKLDKNKSGLIEYEEFKRFIFFDPFPA